MLDIVFFLKIGASLILIYFIRLIQIKCFRKKVVKPETIMIIFGSGGHTSEMLMIIKDFDFRQYKKIYFFKASSDITTRPKFDAYYKEHNLQIDLKNVSWIDIPRSREVKQSYFTSIITTLYSIFFCYFLLTFKLKNVDLLSNL